MNNLDITNCYVGNQEVQKILLGTDLVWPTIDYSQIPLTFEIISGGTIAWAAGNPLKYKRNIQYKVNDGEWATIESDYSLKTIDVNAGDIVQFTANTSSFATSAVTEYTTFEGSTAVFKIYGNIMSIIWGNTFRTHTEFRTGYTDIFRALFRERSSALKTNIVDIKNLVLPATSLVKNCYTDMFGGRAAITIAPELPASVLIDGCYKEMFQNCGNLSKVTCLATDNSATDCTANWLSSVANTGTFVKHPNATWPTGNSGIPSNWTVIDANI